MSEAQTYRDETKAAKEDAENARDDADNYAGQAINARDDAETARDDAETAKSGAQSAKNEAQTAKNEAKMAKEEAKAILDEIKALKEEMEKTKFPEPFGIGSYVFASVRYWDGYENYEEGGYDDDVLPGDEFDGSQLRPSVLKYYEDSRSYDYTEIDRDDYDDYDSDWDEKYLPGRWRAMSFGRKDTRYKHIVGPYAGWTMYWRRGLILFMRIPDVEDPDEEESDSDGE